MSQVPKFANLPMVHTSRHSGWIISKHRSRGVWHRRGINL